MKPAFLLCAALLTGTGKNKDGNTVQFLSAMIAHGPKLIAKISAAVPSSPRARATTTLQPQRRCSTRSS
ncbi:MAG: hypothetical protein JHC85_07285 [Chthoniobacterales bacterium]|nr:hypothetical protein [Chthoniobacterales bacterium]